LPGPNTCLLLTFINYKYKSLITLGPRVRSENVFLPLLKPMTNKLEHLYMFSLAQPSLISEGTIESGAS
jgi:hypothetical protein